MSALVIPARIVIGVTGHRTLPDAAAVTTQVRRTLDDIGQQLSTLQHTAVVIDVLSPLAEGADRLVAHEVLATADGHLDVVLPLEKNDYLEDFESSASKQEFEALLARARQVKTLPAQPSRTEAYAQVGRYVVDHCDLLIAVWDGKPASGQGGTAEIVEYARQKRCPYVSINPDDPARVAREPEGGIALEALRGLERYNAESLAEEQLRAGVAEESSRLAAAANNAQFPLADARAIWDYLLPYYVRADRLALRHQRRYFRAGSWVYALAATAVAVVASAVLFLPSVPGILWVEVALMAAVLAILWLASRRRWHIKWIDYRFLAERLRAALFLAVANVEPAPLPPPRHLSRSDSSRDWLAGAFNAVWAAGPHVSPIGLSHFEALRAFLIEAWIEDQRTYHDSKSRRHLRRHHRLARTGEVLFGLTFIAAVVHVLQVGPELFHHGLAFVALVFPAIGGALGAIRTHREYLRNSLRFSEMVRHLEELKGEMKAVSSPERLAAMVREAEQTMLHETEDWRVVVGIHKPEAPG